MTTALDRDQTIFFRPAMASLPFGFSTPSDVFSNTPLDISLGIPYDDPNGDYLNSDCHNSLIESPPNLHQGSHNYHQYQYQILLEYQQFPQDGSNVVSKFPVSLTDQEFNLSSQVSDKTSIADPRYNFYHKRNQQHMLKANKQEPIIPLCTIPISDQTPYWSEINVSPNGDKADEQTPNVQVLPTFHNGNSGELPEGIWNSHMLAESFDHGSMPSNPQTPFPGPNHDNTLNNISAENDDLVINHGVSPPYNNQIHPRAHSVSSPQSLRQVPEKRHYSFSFGPDSRFEDCEYEPCNPLFSAIRSQILSLELEDGLVVASDISTASQPSQTTERAGSITLKTKSRPSESYFPRYSLEKAYQSASKSKNGSFARYKSSKKSSFSFSASDSGFRLDPLTEDQKRINHIWSETRRRDFIKTKYKEMCSLVPHLAKCMNNVGSATQKLHSSSSSTTRICKYSKSTVLHMVYEYILLMNEKNSKLRCFLKANNVHVSDA